MTAVDAVVRFLDAEDSLLSQPYSRAWARSLPRDAWPRLSRDLRQNIRHYSHVNAE
jgi:hypothetical protein